MLATVLISIIDRVYRPSISRFCTREMFGYALCGGLNMTLDTLWYFVIYHFVVAQRFIDLGVVVVSPHIASLIVVFPITFFTGFWLNRNVAFRVSEYACRRQLFRYVLSVMGSLLLNYVCMKLFVESFNICPTPSKMFTTVVSVCYSFLMGKYYTFTKQHVNNHK